MRAGRLSRIPALLAAALVLVLAAGLPANADSMMDVEPDDDQDGGTQRLQPPASGAPLQGGVQQTGTGAPLQGGVEQTGTGAPLQGGIQQNALQGGAQGTNLTGGAQGWSGTAQQGRMGATQPLQGGAAQNPLAAGASNDPDAGQQELAIGWDTWRNNLMQAIEAGTLAKINVQNDTNFVWDQSKQMMVSRFGMGASVWYAIDVLPDRRIVNIRFTQSSRIPQYDTAVYQAINDLQGKPLLTYPQGSKRRIVTQEGNVKTAATTSTQNYHFGDVEKQRY